MLRLATVAVATAAALGAVAGVGPAGGPPKLRETCLTARERAAAVWFRAADGVRLAGVSLGSGSKGVVLSHEFSADLCSWLPYGRTLAAKGYRVLAIDLRGFGSSGRGPAQAANRFDRDVVAAAKLLRSDGVRRVVLAGGSIGGAATLVAAAELSPSVAGAISLSSPARAYPDLNPLAAVRKLRVPVLFVHGKDDPIVAASDARLLYRSAVSREKHLEIVSGGSHGSALFYDPDPAGTRVRKLLDDFIHAHLGG
jgi:pimeloyl-ACP methyl ester carboxylesterase